MKTDNLINITRLQSGGVITNYYCSSRCRHCLYACSPKWKKEYINTETAINHFHIIKKLGCRSVHVGGGEPFLDQAGLIKFTQTARQEGLRVEYIETNSSWYKDQESAVGLLKELKKTGITTLLVSISPFHNEHIPFKKVKRVMAACDQAGLSVFPWIHEFYHEIDAMDNDTLHSLDEYQDKYGQDYVDYIPSRYWIHFGGRAIQTYKNIHPLKNTDTILKESRPCRELTDTSHFHMDLFGNYIPGLCSGLSIRVSDLQNALDPNEYPLLTLLYNQGIAGLLDWAKKEFEFQEQKTYLSKCHLCLDIRKFVVEKKNVNSIELQPAEFYQHL